MTRIQNHRMEQIAEREPRLQIREGYSDQHIEITTPRGSCFKVSEDGTVAQTHPDFSVKGW